MKSSRGFSTIRGLDLKMNPTYSKDLGLAGEVRRAETIQFVDFGKMTCGKTIQLKV